VGKVIVVPFNEFKKRYIVGRNLDLPYKIHKVKKSRPGQKIKYEYRVEYYGNDAGEAYLLLTWVWSLLRTYVCCCCPLLNPVKTQ
jgi:hypothetical protein